MEKILGRHPRACFIVKVDQTSKNCQNSAILEQKFSFLYAVASHAKSSCLKVSQSSMLNSGVILVLLSKYVIIHIKMLLSLKASEHDWHSVALGLKVSHSASNQCSI